MVDANDNRTLAHRLVRAQSDLDEAGISALLAPTAEVWSPVDGWTTGADAAKALVGWVSELPGPLRVDTVVAADDVVVIEVSTSGRGQEPGQPITEVVKFDEGGAIVELRSYFDPEARGAA